MRATLISFGWIDIDGRRFDHDLVIEDGAVRKRRKGPSKPLRDRYGHTPLSLGEAIPWSSERLVIGTGVSGGLPILPDVYDEARRRRVEIVALPTAEACELISAAKAPLTAILHVTC